MRRALALVWLLLALPAFAVGQAYTTVTATNVTVDNGSGTAVNPPSSSQLCFLGVNNAGVPITYTPSGGSPTSGTVCQTLNGSGGLTGSLQVANPATASPNGLLYTITVINGSTTYLTIPLVSLSGTVWSYDSYGLSSFGTAMGIGKAHIACAAGAQWTSTTLPPGQNSQSCGITGQWNNYPPANYCPQGTGFVIPQGGGTPFCIPPTLSGNGTPSGICTQNSWYLDQQSANVYACKSGAWALVGSSGVQFFTYAGSGAPSATCSGSTNTGAIAINATPVSYQCSNATGSYAWNQIGGAGASYPGVSSDGSNGLAITGKVAAASSTATNTAAGSGVAINTAPTSGAGPSDHPLSANVVTNVQQTTTDPGLPGGAFIGNNFNPASAPTSYWGDGLFVYIKDQGNNWAGGSEYGTTGVVVQNSNLSTGTGVSKMPGIVGAFQEALNSSTGEVQQGAGAEEGISNLSTGKIDQAYGDIGLVANVGSGQIAEASVYESQILNVGSGSIPFVDGFEATYSGSGAGSSSTAYSAFAVDAPIISGSDTIGTMYGYYVSEAKVPGVGTFYPFYSVAVESSFFNGPIAAPIDLTTCDTNTTFLATEAYVARCGGGTGSVTDGSGTSTPLQFAESTSTTHQLQYRTPSQALGDMGAAPAIGNMVVESTSQTVACGNGYVATTSVTSTLPSAGTCLITITAVGSGVTNTISGSSNIVNPCTNTVVSSFVVTAPQAVNVWYNGTNFEVLACPANPALLGSTPTGTGVPVLATSPTLVTPALGTPSAINLSNATNLPATALPTGILSCTEVWSGSGSSSALTSGDDAISNNTCYNDSGATRTITAVKCRSSIASNTTTVNPSFGSAGTGTTILSGALTCGSSYAYSSSGTVSNASWTTGTGIDPVMGGTLTGTSIAVIVEYHY